MPAVVNNAGNKFLRFFLHALYCNQTVGDSHAYRIEAYGLTYGLRHRPGTDMARNSEVFKLVVDKAYALMGRDFVKVNQHVGHRTMIIIARNLLGTTAERQHQQEGKEKVLFHICVSLLFYNKGVPIQCYPELLKAVQLIQHFLQRHGDAPGIINAQ